MHFFIKGTQLHGSVKSSSYSHRICLQHVNPSSPAPLPLSKYETLLRFHILYNANPSLLSSSSSFLFVCSYPQDLFRFHIPELTKIFGLFSQLLGTKPFECTVSLLFALQSLFCESPWHMRKYAQATIQTNKSYPVFPSYPKY